MTAGRVALISGVLALVFGGMTAFLFIRLERALSFAEAHGCDVNEGSVQACIVEGVDHGPRLYNAMVAPWFSLVTMPLALLCGVVALGAGAMLLWRSRRRRG